MRGDDREDPAAALSRLMERRFGESLSLPDDLGEAELATLAHMAARRSHRRWSTRPLGTGLLDLLVRTALCAPSKSDLQQADFIDIRDPDQRRRVAGLVPSMPWVETAPAFLVICGNNRRIRQVCAARGHAFANDHLDAFFNASVDGGIHLAWLLMAAEAVGLVGCPVSVIRNRAVELSAILQLPDHVFPVAGLALGWPADSDAGDVAVRLSPEITCHRDRFGDACLSQLEESDRRRQQLHPYTAQRRTDLFGESADYGWMEEKARHYSLPERDDFGTFVRSKGFRLD